MSAPILITGFEPFDGDRLNPSWEVARALDGRRVAGHRLAALRLPCTFADAMPALNAAIDSLRPCLVLGLGLAASRAAVSIERLAVNLIDARIPDNAGVQPIDEPVVAEGPAAYFTSLPVKALHAALQEAGLPVEVSHSAGTFVCNQVFYTLMHRLRAWPGLSGGFIHLPPLPEQAARYPGCRPLGLDEQVRAILLAVTVALTRPAEHHQHSTGRID